jgi:hypothetical protein
LAYICYIDEAGCSATLPAAKSDIQPLLVIAGLIVPEDAVPELTRSFLSLKRKYFPGLFHSPHLLDDVREEIKGSDLRSAIRKRGMRATAQMRFIDDTLKLIEHYSCRIVGSIWIKGVGRPVKAREIYTTSIQRACRAFQSFLATKDSKGIMVADFRTTQLNDQVAHSVFTQKYRWKGDPFDRIVELPTFGVSNNHVGLQITDLLCSALLFPMASSVYCFGQISGVHVNPRDLVIRRRYTRRLKHLQFKAENRWSIGVHDPLRKRSSIELFSVPPLAIRPIQTFKAAALTRMRQLTKACEPVRFCLRTSGQPKPIPLASIHEISGRPRFPPFATYSRPPAPPRVKILIWLLFPGLRPVFPVRERADRQCPP